LILDDYILVDAHQDIAWNMVTFGRDYTLSQAEIRLRELGTAASMHNGDTLLGWDVYRRSRLAIVFSTLFACPARWLEGDWDIVGYRSVSQARQAYRQQADLYQSMAADLPDKFRILVSKAAVHHHIEEWRSPGIDPPLGLVLLMENAEGIGELSELEEWWQLGLRIIGPAWAGTRFCGGTQEPGPLTGEGYRLLDEMASYGYLLDLSHMHDTAALQALDYYRGRVIATHANAAALINRPDTNRHLSDEVIRGLSARHGVIGVVPYNLFLSATWNKGDSREGIRLEHLADHVDHICQLAGGARHCGIGSDFDGGFGVQSVPQDIDSLADLMNLSALLNQRGYTAQDIRAVLGENWVRLLQEALPD